MTDVDTRHLVIVGYIESSPQLKFVPKIYADQKQAELEMQHCLSYLYILENFFLNLKVIK